MQPLVFYIQEAYQANKYLELCKKLERHGNVTLLRPGWYRIEVEVPAREREDFIMTWRSLLYIRHKDAYEDHIAI